MVMFYTVINIPKVDRMYLGNGSLLLMYVTPFYIVLVFHRVHKP